MPTSAGSLLLGYWAYASFRAAKQERLNHDVIDVEAHEQPRSLALTKSTTNGLAIDRK